MDQSKEIRNYSIAVLVFAVVMLLIGFLLVFDAIGLFAFGDEVMGVASQESTELEDLILSTGTSSAAVLVGIISLIGGIYEIITGIVGIRAYRNPFTVKAFIVLAAISLIYFVIDIILVVVNGFSIGWDSSWDNIARDLPGVVFSILAVSTGSKLRQLVQGNQ